MLSTSILCLYDDDDDDDDGDDDDDDDDNDMLGAVHQTWLWPLKAAIPPMINLLAPSGALVFIMVYYIPSGNHFFKFFKFFRFESESESERTQHVLYF